MDDDVGVLCACIDVKYVARMSDAEYKWRTGQHTCAWTTVAWSTTRREKVSATRLVVYDISNAGLGVRQTFSDKVANRPGYDGGIYIYRQDTSQS